MPFFEKKVWCKRFMMARLIAQLYTLTLLYETTQNTKLVQKRCMIHVCIRMLVSFMHHQPPLWETILLGNCPLPSETDGLSS